MDSKLNDVMKISQQEYTFPNLTPSLECKELLKILNNKLRLHRIIFLVMLTAFLFFMILTIILAVTASSVEFQLGAWDETLGQYVHEKADYTGTIVCAVLCGCTIVVGILNLAFAVKYNKPINYLNFSIKINFQYSAFINQGYDKKEAYKLTLEWLDRQSNLDALNSISTTNALMAMSDIYNINHR